jgi:hypothetical protein
MGIDQDAYWPTTESEKMASIAPGPAKDKRPKSKATAAANHTHRTGAYTRRLTW